MVLPYIDMDLPQVYMCSSLCTPFPLPSPSHPSGASQCTSPEHPVSCIEPGLGICFTYDNIHVSMLFSPIIPPLPSPTESKRLLYTSVSLLLLHCWWECKLVQPLWRTVWRFLKKLEIELPYDTAIPLLGIHTEETRIERDTCTPMFIAALLTIARTWKQPRCPSANERIRKLWYIYTMEYYSAIKKNTFESVLMRWMKLEPIIQSEVSQKEKHQYSILTHIYGI